VPHLNSPTDILLTAHGWERMNELGLNRDDLFLILTHPEKDRPNAPDALGRTREGRCYTRTMQDGRRFRIAGKVRSDGRIKVFTIVFENEE
jgi:hypothetical protein